MPIPFFNSDCYATEFDANFVEHQRVLWKMKSNLAMVIHRHNGAVTKSLDNGLLWTPSQKGLLKVQWVGVKPTTPSSFLLASNRVYTGAVAKSSANGLLDDGFESWYGLQQARKGY